MLPQVIFINDSSAPAERHRIEIHERAEKSVCSIFPLGSVSLTHGLFSERRELVREYILRLSTTKVLQNHQLEAAIRIDTPSAQLHQGWEDPHCQLRGHFAGHWLSALARFAAIDNDPLVRARCTQAVGILADCQARNGNGWAASIPEKYFALLEQGTQVWSPQYTVHKTLAGLVDAGLHTNDSRAWEILDAWADWFVRWCQRLDAKGLGGTVYQGECAGMLELWADLSLVTTDGKYLDLAQRYASPDLFQRLLNGEDPLSGTHANATIPWIQGAARLYEATGDGRFRAVVEAFWNQAVTSRGMFATTGNNAGEYWVPVRQFEDFLGARTQEHCTVYNMIRVAASLLRWTGDSRYADYIERALYNGILAQQNPKTGMVCYFLPLAPGSRKKWGSETTDFWCCHGTLVQAHTLAEELAWHRRDDGISVDQFIPSTLRTEDGITLTQTRIFHPGRVNSAFEVQITVQADRPQTWTLSVRKPGWLASAAILAVDGQAVPAPEEKDGYYRLTKAWTHATVRFRFPQKVVQEYLPGSTRRYAFVDGPVVLAALTEKEATSSVPWDLQPMEEHQYEAGREWQTGHYLATSGDQSVKLVPLYEVTDEVYSVYFSESSSLEKADR